MELAAFWVLLALGVGWAAGQRGRSAPAWFLIAVLLSPLLGAIALALAPARTPVKDDYRTLVRPVPVAPAVREDYTKAIADLADLRDRGAITDDDYVSKKAELLARI